MKALYLAFEEEVFKGEKTWPRQVQSQKVGRPIAQGHRGGRDNSPTPDLGWRILPFLRKKRRCVCISYLQVVAELTIM